MMMKLLDKQVIEIVQCSDFVTDTIDTHCDASYCSHKCIVGESDYVFHAG